MKLWELIAESFKSKELDVIRETLKMIVEYQVKVPEIENLKKLFEVVEYVTKEGAVALNVFEWY